MDAVRKILLAFCVLSFKCKFLNEAYTKMKLRFNYVSLQSGPKDEYKKTNVEENQTI